MDEITPFKSFLPFAGKMLTYLEAIRKPKKHMVNTFAIGKTAIFILPNKDSPPAAAAAGASMTADRNLSISFFTNCTRILSNTIPKPASKSNPIILQNPNNWVSFKSE